MSPPPREAAASPHAATAHDVFAALRSRRAGLEPAEAAARLAEHGPNALPVPAPQSALAVFAAQFLSPLIYVLLAAAVVSLFLGEWSDAAFILAVLLINAGIGASQEHGAERAAAALHALVSSLARVVRGEETYEIDAREIVPGDVVQLESGAKVPADLRLVEAHALAVDESLLTGESVPVHKDPDVRCDDGALLPDRRNMVFAGTLVAGGRGLGIATATGLDTELGAIARDLVARPAAPPPLRVRMERFTRRMALLVLGAVVVLATVSLARGAPLAEVFVLSVALAVSAIPEGLPVALTVALAIGMRRMARRNVIIRRLLAVEALGSCTFIASDKTGTLTINRLAARRVVLPGEAAWWLSGDGSEPGGHVYRDDAVPSPEHEERMRRLALAAVLPNEGVLARRDGTWARHGDAVDVALLVMAHSMGVVRTAVVQAWPQIASIPYESDRAFAASLHRTESGPHVFVKGALEWLVPMCDREACAGADRPLDAGGIEAQALALARDGHRVLAFASGAVTPARDGSLDVDDLRGLVLAGLVGLIDPLRSDAKAAVDACRRAGVEVAMVTGDHPATALAIARELELVRDADEVVTGVEIRDAAEAGPEALAARVAGAHVFARVAPQQKLEIVNALQARGHFVAVTGDGANDAPALRAAHVGAAMGRSGTDVAREAADIVITDDRFSSVVAGIEEGRIAYANVRKVIFLLVSTGAAEIVLFTLSIIAGLPLPLTAVQLLWLNLVTNGIQDVALAFEPAEGDELRRPPRPPREPIFNRIMVERVLLSGAAIGVLAFAVFHALLDAGHSEVEARNFVLLLLVLFENVHVFNCRSETRSALRHDPLSNPFLLVGTVAAQLVHIGAMYTPGLSEVLGVSPVSLAHWTGLLAVASTLLVVMEVHKAVKSRAA